MGVRRGAARRRFGWRLVCRWSRLRSAPPTAAPEQTNKQTKRPEADQPTAHEPGGTRSRTGRGTRGPGQSTHKARSPSPTHSAQHTHEHEHWRPSTNTLTPSPLTQETTHTHASAAHHTRTNRTRHIIRAHKPHRQQQGPNTSTDSHPAKHQASNPTKTSMKCATNWGAPTKGR